MSLAEKFIAERRQFLKSLKLVTVYSTISSLCMLALPIFMLNTYRSVIPSENTSTLIGLFLFSLMLLVCMGIFDAARQIMLARNAARFEANIIGHVMVGELRRQHDPKVQTLAELGQFKGIISSQSFTSIFDLPTSPLFVLIIFLIHPVLGITVLVGMALLIGLTIWADRDQNPYMEKTQDLQRRTAGALQQQFSMQEYVRSQGLYREALAQWGKAQRAQLDNSLKLTNRTAIHAGIAKSSRLIFQISLIAVGALLVLAGDADIIVVFAASIIGGRAFAPIDSLISNWRNLRTGWSLQRDLLQRFEELSVPDAKTPLPPPQGALHMQRVTYVPRPGSPPILRAVNFRVEPGETLALIGPSGAGKSTIARLLVGYLEPSVGVIMLDGQDLKAWDAVTLGHYVGYVPQSVDFFEGTIQQNIASMRLDDPKEWAVQAAQRAGVHDLILSMPKGYDTPMSRAGFWPSGGQAQLIALARAFYGDPRILVLDEPNAALDQNGEQILARALVKAHKDGITTIVVTQRPGLLRFVDSVMTVTAGQVSDKLSREEFQKQQKAQLAARRQIQSTEGQAREPDPDDGSVDGGRSAPAASASPQAARAANEGGSDVSSKPASRPVSPATKQGAN